MESTLLNDMCEVPNIEEVRSGYSQENIHETEGYIIFSKRGFNTLGEMTASIRNNEARIARMETDNKNIRDLIKRQRCSASVSNTLDKI